MYVYTLILQCIFPMQVPLYKSTRKDLSGALVFTTWVAQLSCVFRPSNVINGLFNHVRCTSWRLIESSHSWGGRHFENRELSLLLHLYCQRRLTQHGQHRQQAAIGKVPAWWYGGRSRLTGIPVRKLSLNDLNVYLQQTCKYAIQNRTKQASDQQQPARPPGIWAWAATGSKRSTTHSSKLTSQKILLPSGGLRAFLQIQHRLLTYGNTYNTSHCNLLSIITLKIFKALVT